jgi:diguanylate cyclase
MTKDNPSLIVSKLLDSTVATNFESAAQAVLSFLSNRFGFDLWMVTRVEGDDWIVLQAEDKGYGVKEGDVFRWMDSFCSQMVMGRGPRIAPTSEAIPAYAAAPIGKQVKIAAYMGVPLLRSDGGLFGTLCAIDPAPQPESITEEQQLIELLGTLLSIVMQNEILLIEETRRVERAEAEALTDVLTGLYNRRGWYRLLAAEEERCRRFGHPAFIVCLDLDGLKLLNDSQGHAAGDFLIRHTASVLRSTVRIQDIVARLGGDEFAILGVETAYLGAEALKTRLQAALKSENIEASIGIAMRQPASGLQHAWEKADQEMYIEKGHHILPLARASFGSID